MHKINGFTVIGDFSFPVSEQYKDGGFGLGEIIQQNTVSTTLAYCEPGWSLILLVGHFRDGLPFMQWMVCFVSISS